MTDHVIAVALNLPRGTTPEQVSELLWTRIGFEVPASAISVRDSTHSAGAFIRVTEEALVNFLNRNFESCVLDGQRAALKFEVKKWKGAEHRAEHNRLGIRQL